MASIAPSFEKDTHFADSPQPDEAALHFDSQSDLNEGMRAAKAATDKEHNMTLLQGIHLYPKAVAWSVLISTCICMEGYGNFLEWQAGGVTSTELVLTFLVASCRRLPPLKLLCL